MSVASVHPCNICDLKFNNYEHEVTDCSICLEPLEAPEPHQSCYWGALLESNTDPKEVQALFSAILESTDESNAHEALSLISEIAQTSLEIDEKARLRMAEKSVSFPCSSEIPHLFHFKCIDEFYRMQQQADEPTRFRCPLCKGAPTHYKPRPRLRHRQVKTAAPSLITDYGSKTLLLAAGVLVGCVVARFLPKGGQ